MSTFAVPTPGSVITVSTRYKSSLLGKDYDDSTYEHVPVLQPQSWTKPNEFCIPAENEPFITFRTINIERVTALEVHEGETAPTDIRHGTHHVPVKGSGSKVYTVVVVDGVGKKCDCLGFQYRRDCRHLRMATGEHPVNPRRETVKKQKRKAAAVKRRKAPRNGAPTKAEQVRSIIRNRKAAMQNSKPEVVDIARTWAITEAVEKLGMSRSLATTYVKNNWEKA
jgi:hypothetical protein